MILVTGGAGFIGANFVLDWLATTDEPVVNLDALTYAGNLGSLAGVADDAIFFVGNTMIDTLLANMAQLRPPAFWQELALEPNRYFVMTLQRPANVDDPASFSRLLDAVGTGVRGLPVIFPVPSAHREGDAGHVRSGMRQVGRASGLSRVQLPRAARARRDHGFRRGRGRDDRHGGFHA